MSYLVFSISVKNGKWNLETHILIFSVTLKRKSKNQAEVFRNFLNFLFQFLKKTNGHLGTRIIYGGAFSLKTLNGLLFSIIDIRLSYIYAYENIEIFKSEAKVEQIIAIVTTCSVSCLISSVFIIYFHQKNFVMAAIGHHTHLTGFCIRLWSSSK